MATKSTALREDVRRVLARPYARAIYPDEDGSYFGEIVEFPGCFAAGADAAEALSNLEEVAGEWVRIELDNGHFIPQPMQASDYSGKLVLRISKGLHRKAAWAAEKDGVSLNQFIGTCLAEGVGECRAEPVTTVQMVAISQSTSAASWQAVSNLTDIFTSITGEIKLVRNNA